LRLRPRGCAKKALKRWCATHAGSVHFDFHDLTRRVPELRKDETHYGAGRKSER